MKNNIIIGKMLTYISKIMSYSVVDTYEAFAENTMLVDACVFNLSQLGELANKLDADFTQCYPEIPWHQMRGLRNKIVHDYEGVNLMLVWEIIKEDLPELRSQLEKI